MSGTPLITFSGDPIATDAEICVSQGEAVTRWSITTEVPVALVYNQRNYAVMLATPSDLVDFAAGFSVTERVVDGIDDILEIEVAQSTRGVELRMKLVPDCVERLDVRQTRRNMIGRAGCGVCGLDNAETLFEPLAPVRDAAISISDDALAKAVRDLANHQPLNRRTRSVHAAAWADLDGAILMTREDVGRHNALDKLMGAILLEGKQRSDGFVMMSSRCSYELVEKAARLRVPAIACLSGPTTFAVRRAEECNMALYSRQGDGFVRIV
ncbi:MAG: formate dehydrogenase accessory sulfurtransferase FdhD [Hyphomonadaceae bacterium]